MISLTKDKELKGYKSLTVYPEVAHFVTTRHGGVSEGTYGSFNCSPYTKDSCINVNCNQNKLFQITGHQIKELVIPEQKHGSASLVVDESFFKESLEVRRTLLRGIDALITNVPGYCVCVTTADCVPVLLYDRRLQVVAAVHAGWKGTVQHIVSSVMEHMSRNFGTRGADVVVSSSVKALISFQSPSQKAVFFTAAYTAAPAKTGQASLISCDTFISNITYYKPIIGIPTITNADYYFLIIIPDKIRPESIPSLRAEKKSS